MTRDEMAELGSLLARSAVLSNVGQRDAASALVERAKDAIGKLPDASARELFAFFGGWLEGVTFGGFKQLEPVAAKFASDAADNETASMRSALSNFLTVAAADF